MTHSNTYRKTAAVLLAFIMILSGIGSGAVERAFAAKAKKPAKVKLVSAKRSGFKMTLKWKKAKNAKKYQVYVKAGQAKWKLKKTLKKTTFSMNGAEGTEYSFKVRGVNGKKKGSFSSVKKISIPEKAEPEQPKDKSKEEKAADEVTAMIRLLPDFDEITIDDSDVVEDARTAYNALSDEAKKYVEQSALEKLASLEQTLAELIREKERIDEENKEAANAVSRKIMELYELQNDEDIGLRYSDRTKVDALREEYEALTDAQKEFVSKEATLSVLEELEAVIAGYREQLAASFADWDTVTIDGTAFYKVTEADGKTLLLACDVIRDTSGDPLLMEYGESCIWRDSFIREYLNGEYLDKHPGLAAKALETELRTRTITDEGVEYVPTTDKVFLMTMADICGVEYKNLFTEQFDYTYNGAVLPGLENGEVILDDDELLFWGRDEYIGARGILPVMNMYMSTYYLRTGFFMGFNGHSYLRHDKACLLPALWVETESIPK